MSRRWKLFLIVAPVTILLDQLTKLWARHSLPTTPDGYGIPRTVISNFWDWRLSHNPGSAFGLFGGTGGARIFLTIVGVIAVIAISMMLRKASDKQVRLTVALGLVAGGAIGNLIDRIVFGVVTDFVVWKYYNHEWPTFNVADVALVIGVALLFLDIGREPKESEGTDSGDDGGGGGKSKKLAKKS